MLVKEVLETMGRTKDLNNVLACLQAHLITSNDDILALTKDYCTEIDLPWGLILALKSKIRSYNIQLGDTWSMQGDNKEKMADVTLSLAAPHIAKNKGKIERVVRRQSSKEIPEHIVQTPSEMGDNASEPPSLYPRSPRTNEFSSSGGFGETHALSGAPNDEMKKLTGLLQDHQKSVNVQVDECRTFVMQSMEKIMDVLEQRVLEVNNRTLQAPGAVPGVPHTSSGVMATPAA
jgi:hypothetical protein